MKTLLSLLALASLLAASPAEARRDPAAVALLEEARVAARAVDGLSYEFEFGSPTSSWGWVTGKVRLERGSDLDDGRARVAGTFHDQPARGARGHRFAYATDGERAYELRPAEGVLETADRATAPTSAARLGGNASYGLLPEFLEAKPYWKELEHAETIELAGTTTVAGVECDVVRVTFEDASGRTEVDWHLGRHDRLPRGQYWRYPARGPAADLPFTIHDLRAARFAPGTFDLEPPPGIRLASSDLEGAPLGAAVPDWRLRDAAGATHRLSDLRGKVVVMDFWNTGCFVCHHSLPLTQELANGYRGRDVEFLALNIWEQGDPAAYWAQRGFRLPMLVEADPVAASYGIVSQPAVVVVDARGEVLHAQVGGSEDRHRRIRAAVENGLARLEREGAPASGRLDGDNSGE